MSGKQKLEVCICLLAVFESLPVHCHIFEVRQLLCLPVSHSKMDLLLKERLCSSRSEFFSFTVDPTLNCRKTEINSQFP